MKEIWKRAWKMIGSSFNVDLRKFGDSKSGGLKDLLISIWRSEVHKWHFKQELD